MENRKLFKCLNNINNCLKMLNIINKGYKKILKLFYDNRKSFHLREIAKKTSLNENSAYRFLNVLEKENILKSNKKANLKLFSLNKNNKVYSLLSCFDIERYEKLPSIKKQAIGYFLEKLDKKPFIVILFGSTAKETYRKDSDIDLFLIVNEKINTRKAKNYTDSQTAQIINDFQISFNDFKKDLKMKSEKVLQSALETGYPILNHIEFYRCVEDEEI